MTNRKDNNSIATSHLHAYSALRDAQARQTYATSIPQQVLSTLHSALHNGSPSISALNLLWDALSPPAFSRVLLSTPPVSPVLLSAFDALAASCSSLLSLSQCATYAATVLASTPDRADARHIILACARASAPQSRVVASRMAAVVAAYAIGRARDPAPAVLALADAGFASIAARPAALAATDSGEPALFHALLLLLARLPRTSVALRREVAAAAVRVGARATGGAARAVVLGLRTAVAESGAVAEALLDLYETVVERDDDTAVRIGATDVAFMYVLLSCHDDTIGKKRILELIHSLCEASGDIFAPSGAAASSSAPRSGRTHALLNSLTLPGAEEWSILVADVSDTLTRSPKSSKRETARMILASLFTAQASSRERILNLIFDTCSTGAQGASTYTCLLDDLSSNPGAAALFRAHVPILSLWLTYIDTMPFDAACAIMKCLACISATIPSLCDNFILHLRKLFSSSSRVARSLACLAFVALVEAPATTPLLFDQVSSLLSIALARERDMRVPALSLLVDAVQRATPYSRSHRWMPLNEEVMKYVYALSTPEKPFVLACCFTDDCCNGLAARRDAPLLLEYAIALRDSHQRAALVCSATESHIIDPRHALLDACTPPSDLSDAAQARWVSCRIAVLALLCEKLLNTNVTTHARAALVYSLAFVVRDAIPPALRAKPLHERACPLSTAADLAQGAAASISARERCANESLVGSKLFASLEAAGCVSGCCSLRIKDAVRLLRDVKNVENIVGRFTASVLRAEVIEQLVRQLVSGADHEERVEYLHCEVQQIAVRSFCDTNPGQAVDKGNALARLKLCTEPSARGSRKSTRHANKGNARNSKKRGRPPPHAPLQKRVARRRSRRMMVENGELTTADSSTTSSLLGSNGDETGSEISNDYEIEDVISRITYTPARDALKKAIQKSDTICENARHIIRSCAIRLLLHSASDVFVAKEWSFLVGSSGVNASAIESVREIISLFETDFQLGLTNALALNYLDLLAWFMHRNLSPVHHVAVSDLLAASTTRILEHYSITQVRIIRALFNLLLNSLNHNTAIAVVQHVFLWLGEEQGVLDDAFKEGGAHTSFNNSSFDIDILEEAYAIDGISSQDHNINTDDRTNNEASRPPKKRLSRSDPIPQEGATNTALLPNAVKVRDLGLNDSEESCLVCVQAALERLERALPPADQLRNLHHLDTSTATSLITRLSTGTTALSTLLATQPATLTWARPISRRVSDTVTRLLSGADAALLCVRREMRNANTSLTSTHFSAVLAACAHVLRDCLGQRAVRALATTHERTRRAAARLELHVPAALAELARHCKGAPALADIKDAYRDIAGVTLEDEVEIGDVKMGGRKSNALRMRSRNRVVDAWLQDEDGEDNFADLEDFVVGMDEEEL